jgi:hypothetical protein
MSGVEAYFELQRCTGWFCTNFTTIDQPAGSPGTGAQVRVSDINTAPFVIYTYRVRACSSPTACSAWSSTRSGAAFG